MHRVVILSGSSHPFFADSVAEHLGFPLHNVFRGKFANGETRFELLESVRGADVYVVQTSCEPINDMLMELLMMVQSCRYASAHKITAIVPFFPYARQDKMQSWQQPITAKLVANMLSVAGVNHVLTMDLHAEQLQGFFDIPCDNLSSAVIIIPWIQRYIPGYEDAVIVAPDNGAVKICTLISERLGIQFALFHKQRRYVNVVQDMVLVGDVRGRVAIVVDDIADTSSTLCIAVDRLFKAGVSKAYAIVTHGVFSGDSIEKLKNSSYELVICTNTIPQTAELAKHPKFRIIDVSFVFAKSIFNMGDNKSVHQLFRTEEDVHSLEQYLEQNHGTKREEERKEAKGAIESNLKETQTSFRSHTGRSSVEDASQKTKNQESKARLSLR